jgi:hypothetical protein
MNERFDRMFEACRVMASKYGDQITGLRFFGPKYGNAPESQMMITFKGMNLEQLIAELERMKS